MNDFEAFLISSRVVLIRAGLIVATVFATLLARRIYKRYIANAAPRRNFDERQINALSKLGQGILFLSAIAVISYIMGFGIQGIVVATSSLFALIGVAFFAVWSLLSNITASIIIYFTFPFRIGDHVLIENEPSFSGILKDITLFYLRIQNEDGDIISIPANVAMQKIITTRTRARIRSRTREEAMAKAT